MLRKPWCFPAISAIKNQPLLRDPQYFRSADYVVMESTYGDRSHGERPDYVKELSEIIQTTFDRGGNVVIPSFAVGRTQELLYFLRQIKADGLISGHDGFEVYVDSPLAVESTEIFQDNRRDYFDQEALEPLNRGINPIQFPGLRVSLTSEESKAINEDQRCKVILSASGMCEAGRIKHHLKHNLWRPECTVLFVGYQGAGTLGRALVEGASKVRLFGEEIEVRAQIRRLAGVSGHADNNGLLEWISHFDPRPERVLLPMETIVYAIYLPAGSGRSSIWILSLPIRALSLIWREISFFTKATARKFTKTEPQSPRAVRSICGRCPQAAA